MSSYIPIISRRGGMLATCSCTAKSEFAGPRGIIIGQHSSNSWMWKFIYIYRNLLFRYFLSTLCSICSFNHKTWPSPELHIFLFTLYFLYLSYIFLDLSHHMKNILSGDLVHDFVLKLNPSPPFPYQPCKLIFIGIHFFAYYHEAHNICLSTMQLLKIMSLDEYYRPEKMR